MSNNKFNILLVVAFTALLSTSLSFFLFQQFTPPQQVIVQETKPAQLVNYTTPITNIKPNNSSLPTDFVEAASRVTPAVVNITSLKSGYRASSGSGVVISDNGYIITNHHVIEGAGSFKVTLHDKRELKAELIGSDQTTDLALLKVEGRNLETLDFGDSDNVQVGEWVLAVGNPFNLASTVTAGIVSAKGRNIDIISGQYSIESFIQTDAVVNPGNSGGALVNTRGQLVGINTAILTETGGYEGYSFAIPANLVQKVIEDLKDFGTVKRAILGVSIMDVDNSTAKDLGLSSVSGVLIRGVNGGSGAADAGLTEGDVIVSINNRKTHSMAELQEQVARYRPGDLITLDYIRKGKKYRKNNVQLKGIGGESSAYQR